MPDILFQDSFKLTLYKAASDTTYLKRAVQKLAIAQSFLDQWTKFVFANESLDLYVCDGRSFLGVAHNFRAKILAKSKQSRFRGSRLFGRQNFAGLWTGPEIFFATETFLGVFPM